MKTKAYILISILIAFLSVLIYFSYKHDNHTGDNVEVTYMVAERPTVKPQEDEITIEIMIEDVEPVIPETISVTCENRIKIATMIAKTMFGEGRGLASVTEQACVAWTILNRCDAGYGTIEMIITAANQFCYSADFPTVDDYGRDLFALAEDIISRWEREKSGESDVGRVLPKEYIYFHGKNGHNWFRVEFRDYSNPWDYSLPSPYES